jgi:hypothetical protein
MLTKFAVDKIRKTEPGYWHLNVAAVRDAVGYGSNIEAHYPEKHPYGGNNWGCADVDGWWREALKAKPADIEQAYRKLGIMLHMVQDMGVPAHACHVLHGVELAEGIFHPDYFEWMATYNWKPNYVLSAPRLEPNGTGTGDPGYGRPSDYYRFCQTWTLYDLAHEPAPEGTTWLSDYWAPPTNPADESPGNTGVYPQSATFTDPNLADRFNRYWWLAPEEERELVSRREHRTAWVTYWALLRACYLLHQPLPPAVTVQPGVPRDDEDVRAEATGSEYSGFTGILTYSYQWARSRDGGDTWSGWGWAGATLDRNMTAPWDVWKARARAADPQGNIGDWTESDPVTIIPRVDEDGDPIGNVWFAHAHPKPPTWTNEQWQAHLNAADGRTWGTAFHLLSKAATVVGNRDVILFSRGTYPGENPAPALPGVTLRSVSPEDPATQAATRTPPVSLSGPTCKVLGLTVTATLQGSARGRHTRGSISWAPPDGSDATLTVTRHQGELATNIPTQGVFEATVTDSGLTRCDVWGEPSAATVKLTGNTFSGPLGVQLRVPPPGAAAITVDHNTFTGASASV